MTRAVYGSATPKEIYTMAQTCERLPDLRAQAESETVERAIHGVIVECEGSGARRGVRAPGGASPRPAWHGA